MGRSATLAKLERARRDRAMSYPQTEEAFPWGERAIKVKGKTFLFMRRSDSDGTRFTSCSSARRV